MKAKNSRKILEFLFIAGVVSVAATSPYFFYRLAKIILKMRQYKLSDKQKFNSAFNYLKKNGLIKIEKDGYDIKIFLTPKGEKRIKKYKINDLKIIEPKKWDSKWRIVIFDISNSQRVERNAFRKKLKELGFYSLQKSVWLHPFNCKKEIGILREFFGLNLKQIIIFLADKIEDGVLAQKIRTAYKI